MAQHTISNFNKIISFIKRRKLQIICVMAGFIIFFVMVNFAKPDTELVDGEYIKRETYGKYDRTYSLYVEGLSDQDMLLEIPVSGREYSDEEIDAVFDNCMDILIATIPGNHNSLQEITSDIVLPKSVKEYGIDVTWISMNPEIMDSYGNVKNIDMVNSEDIKLKVELTDGIHTAQYEIPIRVLPQELSPEEKTIKEFRDAVADADQNQKNDEVLKLPKMFDGKKISYRSYDQTDYNIIWIIGILIAVLLFAKEKIAVKEEYEKRERQMLLDYPEIVSKLTVLISSGMTIRIAWAQIVGDYEREQGVREYKRYAYEEMCASYYQLKSGINESKVYRDFGRRCRLKQYMKLSSLLEQNRRNGVANLNSILSIETIEAWEERKNLARRMGEEAGTKLLVPLFLMLGIVMIMIMVPALMSFY